jgi:ABC-type multidrug transport system ATPase subunit
VSFKNVVHVFLRAFYFFRQAAEQSLKVLRIFEGGVADTFVSQYSGGMKRRLSVAISLIGDPKVFVLYSCP